MITTYPPTARLSMYLAHLGIPVVGVSQMADGTFVVTYDPSATAGQIAQGNQIASTWPNVTHKSRTLWALLQDIKALTGKQQGNIYNDLLLGSPPKAVAVEQSNTSAVFSTMGIGGSGGQVYIYAMYTQDNVFYLAPANFDNTINIPGTEPVP